MAQISCRISGVQPDGSGRLGKTFGDDSRQAKQWAKDQGLLNPRTVWYVRLRFDGRTVSESFETRADAVNFANTKEAAKLRGDIIDPKAGTVPFDTYATQWLTSDPSKRPSSLERDRGIVHNHLIPAFDSTALKAITHEDVQALVNTWSKKFASQTVGRQFTTLQAIFSAALRAQRIGRSPCDGINLPERTARRGMIIAPDIVTALAEKVGKSSAAMVYIGAVLGLRWGEVAGLRVGDVDLENGVLHVTHQRTRGEHGRMIDGAPKSKAGIRTLAMPAGLVALLSDHLATRGLTEADHDAYLFVGAKDTPLHYSNWRRRVWEPACEALKIKGLKFHDLRKANATALVLSGVDIKTAQTRLGHSSSQVTLELYAQVTNEGDRQAADKLGAHFFDATFPVRKNGAKKQVTKKSSGKVAATK